MTDNELLLAISDMLDKKLKPVNDRLKKIELTQENDILPRVQMPNITPHVCRNTYCSNMAKSGMNPKTLQYLMGHSDISVTMNVYTHIRKENYYVITTTKNTT